MLDITVDAVAEAAEKMIRYDRRMHKRCRTCESFIICLRCDGRLAASCERCWTSVAFAQCGHEVELITWDATDAPPEWQAEGAGLPRVKLSIRQIDWGCSAGRRWMLSRNR